jgi:hypothetical protein
MGGAVSGLHDVPVGRNPAGRFIARKVTGQLNRFMLSGVKNRAVAARVG